MKHLLTLTLFIGIAWGQSELMGTWRKEYSFSYSQYKIYKSNGKQYIDYKSIDKPGTSGAFFISPSTRILHEPWFGESYFENEYYNQIKGKMDVTKTEVILIDRNTILIGKTKYSRKY